MEGTNCMDGEGRTVLLEGMWSWREQTVWTERVEHCCLKECGHGGNKLVSNYCSYKKGIILNFSHLYLRADSIESKCFVPNYEPCTKSLLERPSSGSNYALSKFRS